MLSFATEFPVSATATSGKFLAAVREWLLGSPHTVFKSSDFPLVDVQEEWSAKKSNEQIEVLRFDSTTSSAAAVRYTKIDDGLEWVSTVVFLQSSPAGWIGIRTSCESQHPSVRLPAARKPVFVRTFLNRLSGGLDGELTASASARILANSEVPLAARCLTGQTGCRLPVVYVSAKFQGGHSVNPTSLADALAGMAHVVVEPNRPFSVRLMQEVKSENIYGGAVGIYWPDGAGRRSFFPKQQFESSAELEHAVVDEVRLALVNRRPLARTTWASVQEQISRRKFAELRAAGSTAVEEYVQNFDKEAKAKQQELEDAELEISRLQAEIRRYQSQRPMQSGLSLQAAPEKDLFAGEILGIVHDALTDTIARVTNDSRRQHVLKRLVAANPPSGEAGAIRSRLKTLLRDYKSMDAKVKAGLQEIGFDIADDGKHIKIIFQGDDRYMFAMPKSGSDVRGGLNLAGDISRLLL
ncbi:MAG: hypothetical protein ACWA6Y_12930 [Polaromonas sp.]